ncbi:Deoxyribonuclease NucA/NucB [Lachnospiraceae bacterium C7]|nr:Deoxyribonuclease NucA/NucB [Lachnospiraceae bacterium C7]
MPFAWAKLSKAGKITEGGSDIVEVKLSKKKYPESARHIEEAIKDGQSDTLTIDRGGASLRRKASLKGGDTVPGLDRDEYPPAMSKEGGTGASIKLINPSDNRGSGSSISAQLRKYPNGTKYKIVITDED